MVVIGHPHNAPMQQIEDVLRVAWMVWNSVIFADVSGGLSLLENLYQLSKTLPESKATAERLVARKRRIALQAIYVDVEREKWERSNRTFE